MGGVILLYLACLNNSFGQDESPSCGTVSVPITSGGTPETTSHCFDKNYITTNCIPIWLKVNIHFFTSNDCKGQIYLRDGSGSADIFGPQNQAYSIAENLINAANDRLANNRSQWHNGPAGGGPCVPIRFALTGVYIHCNQFDMYKGAQIAYLNTTYGVNTINEYDVFVAEYPGDATGVSYVPYSAVSIDWLEAGNFVHEMGHALGLNHSFVEDNLSDTPEITYNWDANCDGDLNDSGDLVNRQCWQLLESPQDKNNNGTNDCDEVAPCVKFPCCTWDYVDNNIMSYNNYKEAFTPMQINAMLNTIGTSTYCGFIAGFGEDCLPPSAFITQTPYEITNQKDLCAGCVRLSASFNDAFYQLQIYETTLTGDVLKYDSGEQPGPVKDYCYYLSGTVVGGAGNFTFKPDATYRIVLQVENSCGEESVKEYIFKAPKCPNNGGAGTQNDFLPLWSYPVPTTGLLQLKFDGNQDELYYLQATNQLTGSTSLLLNNFNAVDGENIINTDLYGYPPGTYTLLLVGEHHIYYKIIVKL